MLVFKREASKRKLTIPVTIIFVETLHTTQCTCLGTCMPSSKSDSWPGLVNFFLAKVKIAEELQSILLFNFFFFFFGWGGGAVVERGASIC